MSEGRIDLGKLRCGQGALTSELRAEHVLEGEIVASVDEELVLDVLWGMEILALGVLAGATTLQSHDLKTKKKEKKREEEETEIDDRRLDQPTRRELIRARRCTCLSSFGSGRVGEELRRELDAGPRFVTRRGSGRRRRRR